MASPKSKKYIETVGRRKSAVARVRLTPDSKTSYKINDGDINDLFKTQANAKKISDPFEVVETDNFFVSVLVKGGGLSAQADAIRLGIARALIKHNSELRPELKSAGFLTRDPRVKERKKFGLKKARKSPQWSKR